MSRKRPSTHSDEQFALFVERMRSPLQDIDLAKFAATVRALARAVPPPQTAATARSPAVVAGENGTDEPD